MSLISTLNLLKGDYIYVTIIECLIFTTPQIIMNGAYLEIRIVDSIILLSKFKF